MDTKRTALLIGASGLVGGSLLRLLLADERYERVVVLSRRKLGLEHPRLTTHIVDFENPDTFKEKLRAEDLFCTFGTTMSKAGTEAVFRRIDLDIPLAVARHAVAGGARRMIHVSSVGASPRSRFFYLRSKGDLEAALQVLPFAAIHILRPATLIGERNETRLREHLGVVASRILSPFLWGPWRKYRSIPAETVARAMIRLASADATGVHIIESDEIARLGRV